MTSFRFLHTGDIHLDSPLRGLAGYEGPAAERIRTATRSALDNLVTQAIEEQVDFVIVAGDLYDGDWRDYQTGLFFVRQMGRLAAAQIPAFVLHGNHDAESQITKRLVMPKGVEVFATRKPQTFKIESCRVALHGQSFRQRDVTDNLALGYPNPLDGYFNIGVLHTGLGGMGGHANYAPCTLDDLTNKGYGYWALGHVHKGVILHERPHVVFCGNLQGRHIRETGAKAACLVSVDDGQVTDVSNCHADVVRWVLVDVPVSKCTHLNDVIDCIRDGIEHAVAHEGGGRLIVCRIELSGTCEIHGQLLVSTAQLIADARSVALALGDEAAWIEKVVVSTKPPASATAVAAQLEALGDLHSLIGQASTDGALLGQLEVEIGDLVRKLPHDVRSSVEDPVLGAAIEKDFRKVLEQAGAYLSARLLSGER